MRVIDSNVRARTLYDAMGFQFVGTVTPGDQLP